MIENDVLKQEVEMLVPAVTTTYLVIIFAPRTRPRPDKVLHLDLPVTSQQQNDRSKKIKNQIKGEEP